MIIYDQQIINTSGIVNLPVYCQQICIDNNTNNKIFISLSTFIPSSTSYDYVIEPRTVFTSARLNFNCFSYLFPDFPTNQINLSLPNIRCYDVQEMPSGTTYYSTSNNLSLGSYPYLFTDVLQTKNLDGLYDITEKGSYCLSLFSYEAYARHCMVVRSFNAENHRYFCASGGLMPFYITHPHKVSNLYTYNKPYGLVLVGRDYTANIQVDIFNNDSNFVQTKNKMKVHSEVDITTNKDYYFGCDSGLFELSIFGKLKSGSALNWNLTLAYGTMYDTNNVIYNTFFTINNLVADNAFVLKPTIFNFRGIIKATIGQTTPSSSGEPHFNFTEL